MHALRRRLRQVGMIAVSVAVLTVLATPAGAIELWDVEPPFMPSTSNTSVGAQLPAQSLGFSDSVSPLSGAAGSVSALAADDVAPGVDINDVSDYPRPVVSGSLNFGTDVHDIYQLYASAGEQIYVYADVPSGSPLALGMRLYRWNGGSPEILRSSMSDGADSDWLCYTVPDSYPAGVYYVEVYCGAGADTYELAWAVTSGSDGNVPGVTIPSSPFMDTVSTDEDFLDVFAVNVGVGEGLNLNLAASDAADTPSLYLFAPSTTDVWKGGSVSSTGPGNNLNLSLPPRIAGEAGTYYVAVVAGTDPYVDYTLTWSTSNGGVNMPGLAMPTGSPFTRFLGVTDCVYYVDLEYGQRIDVDLKVVGGAASMKLFGPNAVETAGTYVAAGDPISYWVSSAQAGRYYLLLHPTLAGSSVTIDYTITDGVEREAGSDRYATSALVSKADFPNGADVVVVATGADFPDALSASSLAGAFGAPVLLTKPASLPGLVKNEIARLGATRCFIVGGEAAVDPSVVAAIDAIPGMGTPVRIAGTDRYSTAAAVAETTLWRQGAFQIPVVFVARGDDFADALSLAPIGWGSRIPILLTKPTKLSAATASLLAERSIVSAAIAGGPEAITEDVEDEIDAVIDVGYDPTTRKYGANRYATAAVIAEWSATSPWLDWSYVGLATGTNFPDALGGGAGAAKKGGVLLLTRPTELSGNTSSIMNSYKAQIDTVQLLGGTVALTNPVESAVGSIVQ